MAKKRILVVTQHFWPENFRINDIANYLTDEKDCIVDVLCGIPNYPAGKFFEGYGYFKKRRDSYNKIAIERVFEIPRGDNSNFRIFVNYVSFPIASIFHIPRLLLRRYDHIFLYQLSPVMMSFAGIIVGKVKKTKTSMYVLDLWPENLFSVLNIQQKFLRKLVTKISHWHYKKVDSIIVLSEQMKQKLLSVTKRKDNEIIVIPQACEKIYETQVADKQLGKKFSKGYNVVFTGNISPAQSFETIVEAAAILNSRGIRDINWIVVGDGMSKAQVEKLIQTKNLTKNFHFEGRVDIEEIPKYTYIADTLIGCLVKSDLLEATIPAKVMSYIASGKPIVLAMDGEVQELISKKIRCGYAGPAGDSQTFADNIEKMYRLSEPKRLEMSKNAQKYHFKHFERNLLLNKMYEFMMK